MRDSGYACVLALVALSLAGFFLATGHTAHAYVIAIIGVQLMQPFLGQKSGLKPPEDRSA